MRAVSGDGPIDREVVAPAWRVGFRQHGPARPRRGLTGSSPPAHPAGTV